MMEIVIKISEDVFTRLFDNGTEDYAIVNDDLFAIAKSIRKGTPLPEHHGDLIDRTELYNQTAEWEAQALEQANRYNPEDSRDEWRWWSAVLKERGAFKHDVADAPTIIEGSESE